MIMVLVGLVLFYFCENVVVFNIFLDWKLERFK